MDDIANRIASVRSRIDRACERSGRDPSAVTLIAVTKTHPAEAVAEAWQAGIRDFGENRVQEAAPKIEALRSRSVTPVWHLIGHLQRNKVNVVLGLFDILHSVDSVTLAEAISARAATSVRVSPLARRSA